ncbi:MAG: hypothetical protein E4H23_10310 [Chrysiogenales bacterium]|nr:MAG: hypothetical protein E4H23_10310 [Chrysiogenales bacterium]
MKRKSVYLLLVCLLLVALGASPDQGHLPVLKGPYLGQKPPGTTPEVFAPGLVSIENSNEYFCLFWDHGKHLVFLRDGSGYFESIFDGSQWTELKNTEISAMEPCNSPSEKKLFYNVFKKDDKTGNYNAEIWTMEKRANTWSKPEYSGINGMGPAVDLEGNLYYSTSKDGLMCIGVSYMRNGKYTDEMVLPPPIYSEKELIHPCVAPDGSWMIFNTENQKYYEQGCGLYVSFKKNDGTWTMPQNMKSQIPITGGPLLRISSDGKYLFYTQNGDIYWVSAKIIEALRPKDKTR